MPLKPLERAKSRLRGAVPAAAHPDLVLALALDTVAAVLACPLVGEVVVITSDPVAGRAVAAGGARVLPDRPDAGLNPALDWAAAGLSARPLAAVTADLPALRPADLTGALDRAHPGGTVPARWFVPDMAGTGTTLLAAAAGAALAPRFGPGSAAAHAASGAVRLDAVGPGLRTDVDSPADLRAAVRLGVGRHTAALCRSGPVPGAATRPGPAAGGRGR